MKQKANYFLLTLVIVLLRVGIVHGDWPMPGHDPQRTSWASEDTIGICDTFEWHKVFYPLIPSRVHAITVEAQGGALDMVLVTTADGIYALNPDNGTELWNYPMELPPGDAPTVIGTVMYVGGTDKTVHAVNTITGLKIWQTLEAGAGFYCNPLVVNSKVYAGNRDGFFYCFNASDGSLDWYYEVGDPIALSAAYQTYTDYPNGVIFFAAKDNRAYALKADDGSLVWQSEVFSVDGITAYWPVVFEERVIFVAATNYPTADPGDLNSVFWDVVAADPATLVDANGWMNLQHHIDHLTQYPWRRTFFVLNRSNGQQAEVSPYLWWNNPTGNRYPPAIGPNPVGSGNMIWASTIWGPGYYNSGRYAGWQLGAYKIRPVPGATGALEAGDEPEAHSIIGDTYLYYNRGGDGHDAGGVFYLGGGVASGGWYGSTFPGDYNSYWSDRRYGNSNSTGWHGHQNPPVPLKGKVYFYRSSSIICMRS